VLFPSRDAEYPPAGTSRTEWQRLGRCFDNP